LVSIALDPRDERAIGSSPNLSTLAQIAEPLVRQIRTAQPEGPYYLGGWCAAGILAYEVASQLVAAGQSVNLMALVGAPNPVHFRSIPRWRMNLSKLTYRLAQPLRLSRRAVRDDAAERLRKLASKLIGRKPADPPTAADKIDLAAYNYRPKPLHGRVALIRPSERPQVPDLKIGWEQVLGDRLEVYDVAGDHVSMFLEPNVEGLAACLNQCLDDSASLAEIGGVRRRAIAG
jgi:thioesterase domain-containing protein